MNKTISFRNFESEAHLKDFIDDYLENGIGLFIDNRPLKANVVVERQQVKSGPRDSPNYNCEVIVYHPSLKKQIVAKKTSPDFYQSVRKACQAIEKSLRRLSQTRSKRRHRSYELINHVQVTELLREQSTGEVQYELAK